MYWLTWSRWGWWRTSKWWWNWEQKIDLGYSQTWCWPCASSSCKCNMQTSALVLATDMTSLLLRYLTDQKFTLLNHARNIKFIHVIVLLQWHPNVYNLQSKTERWSQSWGRKSIDRTFLQTWYWKAKATCEICLYVYSVVAFSRFRGKKEIYIMWTLSFWTFFNYIMIISFADGHLSLGETNNTRHCSCS
jgi:hypothetical protein